MQPSPNGNTKFENACAIWFCPTEVRTARELHQLPPKERERLWGDFSGESRLSRYQILPEIPLITERAISEVKEAISREAADTSVGMALRLSPGYVLDNQFIVKFLRAVEFDVQACIVLFQRHFQMKQDLFGHDKLGRDILISDLSPEEMEFLGSGSFQFLPEPDSTGRLIHFIRPILDTGREALPLIRAFWYHQMIATNSERAQKLGAVRVVHILLDEYNPAFDKETLRLRLKLQECIPLRYNAIYVVVNPGPWTTTVEVALFVVSRYWRLRTRFVSGTFQETCYALMCLGIPINCIPLTANGQMLLDYTKASIARWQVQDKDKAVSLGLMLSESGMKNNNDPAVNEKGA